MIESSEDLRAMIRELGGVDPDPGRVTEKILADLSDEEARLIAALTLRDYVRHVLAMPRPVGEQKTFETANGKRTVSWKTAAIIDHIDAELAKGVFAAKGVWKHFGDCAEVDLLTLVDSRRKKSRELVAEAERYELVLSALRDAQVQTVREIPRDVLARVLAR
jgi:hypothetical protein